MLKGQISFIARIAAQHITFPKFTAKAPWPNVETIEIESAHEQAEEIDGTVHVTGIASEALGTTLATDAIEDALNRLVYDHGVSIEPARIIGSQFDGHTAGWSRPDRSSRNRVPVYDGRQLWRNPRVGTLRHPGHPRSDRAAG